MPLSPWVATARLARLLGQGVFPARSLGPVALRTDLHLHTTFTDGRSTVVEMLEAASTAGLLRVAFTEHVRRGISWYPGFRSEVERERTHHAGLQVLMGLEAKALDLSGSLDADPELIQGADIVLGAFHNYPNEGGGFTRVEALSAEEAVEGEFRASWHLLEHPEVDVLAHPGALTHKYFGAFPDELVYELVDKAAFEGRAIELNGEYPRPEQLESLLTYCQRKDCLVTLGSNAHHAQEVGRIARRLTELLPHAD